MNEHTTQRKLSKKAIAWGVIVDVVGTQVMTFVISFITGFTAGVNGTDVVVLMQRPTFLILLLLVGAGMTILGGFVAAYTARYRMVSHAIWDGIIMFILSILVAVISIGTAFVKDIPTNTLDVMLHVVTLIAVIPLAYLGGRIAVRWYPELPTKQESDNRPTIVAKTP